MTIFAGLFFYPLKMKWFVLYTSPRAEKQVDQRLKMQGVETYLPLHLTPRKWSDRIKMVEMPLFSSYIFVRTTDEILRTLLMVNGVSRIIFHNGSPAIIRDQEIIAIQEFVQVASGHECSFHLAEEVRVACGPLKNISGKITRIQGKYLVLHIEQLGLTISLNHDQVVKA